MARFFNIICMPKHINLKQTKPPIYGRAPLLQNNRRNTDIEATRYYNYLLMVKYYHYTNTQPHANKVVRQLSAPLPVVTMKEEPKNIPLSYLLPHWIVEIFTRQKVENEILQNT